MKRRDFLQAAGFLTVSAATLGLNACVGGSDSPTDGKFPQGVASADPQPDAIVLWTRAVPASADDIATPTDAGNLAVKLQVTASDNSAHIGSTVALTGTAVANVDLSAQAGYDYTLRHKLTGLMAGTTYYYQFSAGAARSAIGRFKTAPAKSATPAQLKFAALVCQDWSVNHWATFSDLVASEPDLDFFLHLGDYIYESVGKAFQTGEVETAHSLLVLPNGTVDGSGVYATTVADYRYLYKRYRSDARLQAVHARYAMIAIWDDHEFSDDCWGDAETYDNGTYNASTGLGDNTHQTARRRYANQAWFEFMPADIRYDDSVAGYQTIKLYRDLQFGTLAHVVMTDQRLYRSDHLIPEAAPNPVTGAPLGNIGSRALVPETVLYDQVEAAKIAAGTAAGDRLALVSMLGATQRAWLKTTLQNSPATWKLWGSEVMLTRMGLDGSNAIATLIALSSISTLATSIGTTATSTGSVTVAAALVAAMTAGATQATASAAAVAIATADASAGNLNTAATGAGLSATQAGIAVAVHATELHVARAVVEAGADVLVHGVDDAVADAAFQFQLKAQGVVYTPTFAVNENYSRVLGLSFRPTALERLLDRKKPLIICLLHPKRADRCSPERDAVATERLRDRGPARLRFPGRTREDPPVRPDDEGLHLAAPRDLEGLAEGGRIRVDGDRPGEDVGVERRHLHPPQHNLSSWNQLDGLWLGSKHRGQRVSDLWNRERFHRSKATLNHIIQMKKRRKPKLRRP